MTDTAREHTPVAGPGWGWIVGYGVLSVLLGLAALVWPFPATLAATFAIGIMLIVSGAVSLVAGLRGTGAESRAYAIVLGLLSIVAGGVMVAEPLTGAVSLTLVVAIWLAVRGAAEIWYGFRMRRRRWLMVVLGAVNLLLAGFIVATVPFSALTLPGFVLGVSFLFGGFAAIMAGSDHRRGASAFALS